MRRFKNNMSIFLNKNEKENEKEIKKIPEEKTVPIVIAPSYVLRGRLMLRRPHVSEKTTRGEVFHQYTFLVDPAANKHLVKDEVERLYKVNITAVNMVRLPAKPKQWMRKVGKQSVRKKAIVTLKKGEKIELM